MPTNSKSEVAHTNSDRAANKPPHDYANGHVVDEVVYAAPHFILPPGAQWVPVTTMPPYRKVGWRKGKWFDEEEAYTKKLIEVFTNGYLNIPGGTTLRCYLADRLSCDPMRITKKFAGSSCIGKQVYVSCDTKTDPSLMKRSQDELRELEEKFKAKVEAQQALDYYPLSQASYPPITGHLPQTFPDVYPPEFYASYATAMAQSKAQVTAGLPYYHHPLMSPHPHLPAITLPGITAMNGLPVFGALSPLHPGVPMLPAAAAGDPLRMLTHSSVPMSTTVPIPAGSSSHTLPPTVSVINPSPVLPITHRAAPSAFAPAINPPKMHTVRSVDGINEMRGVRGSCKSTDKISSLSSQQEEPLSTSQRCRAGSAEVPVPCADTDLNASELLLNFFKAAGGSTSSEDTGNNGGTSFSLFSSAESELESKSNGTTDDEQRSEGQREHKSKRGLHEGGGIIESNMMGVSKKLKIES